MGSIHGYALRIAMLVLVSAFAFGAIAAVAIVRLQDADPGGTEPGVAEFVAEPMVAPQVTAAEPEAEALVAEIVAAEPVAEPPVTRVAAIEPAPEPPAPQIAAEPDPEPLIAAPVAETPPSPTHQEMIRQSFVSFMPEPTPQPAAPGPEPAASESGVPQWLDLPGMTPTLEGLQPEIVEVALADAAPEGPEATPEPAPELVPEITATPDENCDTASADWAMFLFENTNLGNWGRVPNVRVVSMGFCADTRQAVESRMQADARLAALRGAAAGDQLVSLALQRAARGPEDVFAMATEGAVLNVYVY
ncbi:hypothetical protein [Pelagibacterium sp.]|uniref:hypothetical protein n=1 Tax=Pelagibacterium sp. TaxID=1967288 RepID=UPI003BACAD1D